MNIDYDLENTPLEIKTDTAVDSGERTAIYFKDSRGSMGGGIFIEFKYSNLQYSIHMCQRTSRDFPYDPPSEQNKVWRISLKRPGPRILVHCNEKVVLNLTLSDSECGYTRWNNNWSRKVAKIQFSTAPPDTASNFYRPYTGKLQNTIII